ncbi:MAG: hypothetical protein ACR2LC_07005 [Pyrinomonadaceae bacterium]
MVAPESGSIETIKDFHDVYVICEDTDVRKNIVSMLRGYDGVTVVDDPKVARFYLEYSTLSRDVAPGYGGKQMALKSQMRAFIVKEDKTRVTAWSETETYDMSGGMSFSAPNEINLTHHFINLLQVTRGEKKSSMRQLYGNFKHKEKEEKSKEKKSKP